MFIWLKTSIWEFQSCRNGYRHVRSNTPEVLPSNMLSCVINPVRKAGWGTNEIQKRKKEKRKQKGPGQHSDQACTGKELLIEAKHFFKKKKKKRKEKGWSQGTDLKQSLLFPLSPAVPIRTSSLRFRTWHGNQNSLRRRLFNLLWRAEHNKPTFGVWDVQIKG